MNNLVEQYTSAYTRIVERAIYVNDMLYGLDLPEHLEDYKPPYCGMTPDMISEMTMPCGVEVKLIHYPPYEDYSDTWSVPASYIDMSDGAVVEDYIKRITEQQSRHSERNIELLMRTADSLGYKLVEKE